MGSRQMSSCHALHFASQASRSASRPRWVRGSVVRLRRLRTDCGIDEGYAHFRSTVLPLLGDASGGGMAQLLNEKQWASCRSERGRATSRSSFVGPAALRLSVSAQP